MAPPKHPSVKKGAKTTSGKGNDPEKENKKPSGQCRQRDRAPPGSDEKRKPSGHHHQGEPLGRHNRGEPLGRHNRGEPSSYRGQSPGYRAEPSHHQAEPSDYRGQPSDYRGQSRVQPSGYRGEPSGHRAEPSGHRAEPSGYHHQPAERHLQPPRPHHRRDRFAGLVEDELKEDWMRQQLDLKKKQVQEDSARVRTMVEAVTRKDSSQTFYVGGVDISFIKGNEVDACAALVIIAYPSLELVYKRLEMIKLTAPYIPGFLAFREVDSLERLYMGMMRNAPQYKPDVMIVDGNGMMHPRRFGLACHLGVMLDIPCAGVAKTLMHVDGIRMNQEHHDKISQLEKAGDTFPLVTPRGRETLGMALRSSDDARNPVYVSQGHKISLQSTVAVVMACCKYRIPEPTRWADRLSRQYLDRGKRRPEEWIKPLAK